MRRVLAFLRSGRGLSGFAAAALGWMVLVILWGAVVRATGSGAGCGDHWPRCNGTWVPQHPRLATVIEFTHRSMSGVCTAITAILVAWTFLAHRPEERVRKAAVWSGILLITEALLGAVLVLGGYVEHNASDTRVLVQCVHFTNTMLLLAALSLTWWWQRPRQMPLANPAPKMTQIAWAATILTIITGATGSVAALADTLFPAANLRDALFADLSSGSPLLVRMRWMHPAASIGAFACIVWLSLQLNARRRNVLLSLLVVQIALGFADVFALAPITLQVLHLLGADLLWIALVVTAGAVLFGTGEQRSRLQGELPGAAELAARSV